MALSREEIEQLARATAQEVVNTLHRYPRVYQDPENVLNGLSQSMEEEITAEKWYRLRAEHARRQGDELTAELYEHIAGEEDGHYREFLKQTGKILQKERAEVTDMAAKMLEESVNE